MTKQRVAVITGAAGGMGRAIVAALLRDGLKCFGIDIEGQALKAMEADIGPDFVGIQADLTDPDQIATGFERIAREAGGVDVLVNNAGTCLMSEFPDISPKELDLQMSLNFSSAFHCSQEAIKLMQGRATVRKIVNISSNGAYNFDAFDPPHYRASKAALDTLTKDLARRFARDRIAVNSIAPAMTETPLFKVVSKEVLEAAIAQMPHGRAMQPAEVAEWVRFLASPAGDISSGNVIILNQGRDVR
ncbi:SDR family NAD(P)-dependent oxidoreductase [Roseovarius sp.]|uniref:SDR family NAD(P)-dependent oxidoreductase n=1 Tax=Roseovarius sp. TaxID=1486281 RepID=UPI00356A1D23